MNYTPGKTIPAQLVPMTTLHEQVMKTMMMTNKMMTIMTMKMKMRLARNI